MRSTVHASLLGIAVLAIALGCVTNNGTDASASVDAMPIADPLEFCRASADAICTRAFQCVPAAMQDATFTAMYYGSAQACMMMFESGCTDPTECPSYDPMTGGVCVAQLYSSACSDLLLDNAIFPPGTCISACNR